METIRFSTWIDAPVERCFLLSLSVDLHAANERAIAGVREGLIHQGQRVTFKGRHFGVLWRHTSLVDLVRPYSYFREVMIEGPFERFEHEHHFATMDDGTRIRDEIRFSTGWGVLGRLATKMIRKHLTEFVFRRNAVIKRVAESEEWRRYLEEWPRGREAPPADAATARRWNRDGLLRGSHGIVAPRGNG